MKNYIYYCLSGLILISGVSYGAPITNKSTYWKCSTHDKTAKEWIGTNEYRKVAINIAFDSCKKQSEFPLSCKTSNEDCEGFVMGVSTKPMWRCTAIDKTAEPWQSNFYTQRDDAAFAANAFCKANSTVPETCYVNFVTCRNLNEGALL